MKKYLLIPLLSVLLFGCTAVLKGKYIDYIIWRDVNMSYDESFDRAIEVFVTTGADIKNIDRANGIIQIDSYVPYYKVSRETPRGKPKDPESFVVSSSTVTNGAVPSLLTVLIRPSSEQSKSRIGIRLVPEIRPRNSPPVRNVVASTGYYEKTALDAIEKIKNK